MTLKKTSLAESAADVDRLCGGAFFASSKFAHLWETKGARPVVWSLQEDGEVTAVLPGVEFGRGFLTRFMAMPDGCYGGVHLHSDLGHRKDELCARLIAGIRSAGYLRAFIFDFTGDIKAGGALAVVNLETTLVDISNPGWVPPDRDLLSQIRKAEREGIRVQLMDWSRHGDRFMKLMAITEKRHHQKPSYPRAFYRQLADLARQDDRVHWVWCEYEGQGVCSHIYVIERGILQGWQIHFDKQFSFLKPNQYIRFTTCRAMARRGIRLLNLGGTPDNAPGLAYYKKRWGGRPYTYRGLVHHSRLGRLLYNSGAKLTLDALRNSLNRWSGPRPSSRYPGSGAG